MAPKKRSRPFEEPALEGNPLLSGWQAARQAEPQLERAFDRRLPEAERERLYYEAEDPELAHKYAWAIPDARAIRIVAACSPVVEIGAGRGYWGRLVRDAGGEIACYDICPQEPPSPELPEPFPNWYRVELGGPEAIDRHPGAALMLCYPDDFERSDSSMALEALERYKGDTVIHIGELFGQSFCKPGAFGKTTGPDAQVYLAEHFHKLLQVPLPSWSASCDTLSVWRRSQLTEIDDSQYADVPPEERVELVQCCEQMRHLVVPDSKTSATPKAAKAAKQKKQR